MYTLFKREIRNFLSSLIGYIVIVIFLLINGFFLWGIYEWHLGSFFNIDILINGYANIDGLFMLAPVLFLLLIPAITMSSFAEEKRSGTMEILMTKPLTDIQIILAKYLAGIVIILFSLLPTLIYYGTVYYLGNPVGNLDAGGTWGSYIGLFFLAATFVSIGLFASTLTRYQIISWLIALGLCLFIYIGFDGISLGLDIISPSKFTGNLSLIIEKFGIREHYSSISLGVIDSRDILYFLSIISIFIILSKIILESRKSTWQGWKNITTLAITFLIVISLNITGSFVHNRYDMTAEKRYSLSDATKKLLTNLDDVVYFKFYLEGDLPSSFRRLHNETDEMLNQFSDYSDNIEYDFIDPYVDDDKVQFMNLYKQLYLKGLTPSKIVVKNTKGSSQQVIFPGAIVTYNEREVPLNLLNTKTTYEEVDLNNTIQSLEYNIASTIKKLTDTKKSKIAFIDGHGELSNVETGDIAISLADFYSVEHVTINHQLNALKDFDAIIIAKPDSVFDDKDKFIIDQFIMKGGKALWLIDPVFASMDSLRSSNSTIGIAQKLGIEDQLYRYGVRINYDLIQDIEAQVIPVKTGNIGNTPNYSYYPWYFNPLIIPSNKNPIVKNLDAIKTEFISSIDTLNSDSVTTTILLTTSKKARTLNTPVNIDLAILDKTPDERLFTKSEIPVAVLLEGKFTSLFKNRIDDTIAKDKDFDFREQSVPTQMIVISDGDMIKNDWQTSGGEKYPLPLGYDKWTFSYYQSYYGNKDFLLNCIDYMCDDSGLMEVRSRELKLRLLDKTKTSKQKLSIQVLNIGAPVFIVLLFGLIHGFIRKRKYSK